MLVCFNHQLDRNWNHLGRVSAEKLLTAGWPVGVSLAGLPLLSAEVGNHPSPWTWVALFHGLGLNQVRKKNAG